MASLSDGWGIEAAHVTYLAVGGGSYHWVVAGGGGTRYFITVDDLDRKGYLGPVRDSALEGLRRAFGTALALRDRGGLEFVLAPMPAASGASDDGDVPRQRSG